jgi:hypothetical protein
MSAIRTAHSKFEKTLQGLRPEARAPFIKGILCISIEKDVNMGIRKKSILTALAIMLIAPEPGWSQSLLKTLDPDNDGTVDLAEAKSAASKLFDKLDRITTALSTSANCVAGSTPRISPRAIPTMTEL